MRKRHYAELHCKTNFSFLQGASHADELVPRAADLGYRALAITDVNSLAGVVRAHAAAKTAGLKLLIGAEITPEDAPPVLLYATNAAGYRNLSKLITRGRRAARKGECQLFIDDVAEHADGLIATVVLNGGWLADTTERQSLRRFGTPFREYTTGRATLVSDHSPLATHHSLSRYRSLFGGRCYMAAAMH